jgi:hypothetical protein
MSGRGKGKPGKRKLSWGKDDSSDLEDLGDVELDARAEGVVRAQERAEVKHALEEAKQDFNEAMLMRVVQNAEHAVVQVMLRHKLQAVKKEVLVRSELDHDFC